jgi:hypothetical protein
MDCGNLHIMQLSAYNISMTSGFFDLAGYEIEIYWNNLDGFAAESLLLPVYRK